MMRDVKSTLFTILVFIPSLLYADVVHLTSHRTRSDGNAATQMGREPQRGGEVTSFIAQIPTQLDPHQISTPDEMQAVVGLYSQLLQTDPGHPTELLPDLTEQWTVDSKGVTYDFDLRRGVQWHDGAPFTSADVVATFTRLLKRQFRHSRCGSRLQSVLKRVEALDQHRVRFRLSRPDAVFLSLVASPWCAIVARHILARDVDLSQVENQIGTGAFQA